jgi:hypothetical protein
MQAKFMTDMLLKREKPRIDSVLPVSMKLITLNLPDIFTPILIETVLPNRQLSNTDVFRQLPANIAPAQLMALLARVKLLRLKLLPSVILLKRLIRPPKRAPLRTDKLLPNVIQSATDALEPHLKLPGPAIDNELPMRTMLLTDMLLPIDMLSKMETR